MSTIRNIMFLLLFASLLGSSCGTSQQAQKQGNYELATYRAIDALRQNSNKWKDALVLEKAFKVSNDADLQRIQQLKLEGNPANWPSIFNLYQKINNRQAYVKPLLPVFIRKEFRNADIQLVDIDREMADAKNNLCEYWYNSSLQLLGSGKKEDARKAHAYLSDVVQQCGSYKDSRQKLNEAREKGTVLVSLQVENRTNLILPQDFEALLKQMNTQEVSSTWVQYTSNAAVAADYKVLVSLQRIEVTPERIAERTFREKRVIQDGFEYELDKNGNVVKDSLGNDVKKPKMIPVYANITETVQTKACMVAGNFAIQRSNDSSLLFGTPFSETVAFENVFIKMMGDKRALSDANRARLGNTFIPFPPDAAMILDATSLIKQKLNFYLRNNAQAFMQ